MRSGPALDVQLMGDHLCGKLSATDQPTRPTQPFILSRPINWVVSCNRMFASSHGWRRLVNAYGVKAWCGWLEGAVKMQQWKIQELKHMKSRPYRNLWRSKLESGCVWLSAVDSRQLVVSPTELTGLVPRVGVIHFDVEADSDFGAQKLRVFILLLYAVFSRTCVQCIW